MNFFRLKIQWQIAIAMAVGVLAGLGLQQLDARPDLGFTVAAAPGRAVVVEAVREDAPRGVQLGDRLLSVGGEEVRGPDHYRQLLARRSVAELVPVVLERAGRRVAVTASVRIHPDSTRAAALAPFDFAADLFMRLLQMLIVPLILTSIVSGVTSVGGLGALGRMGLKTLAYYVASSLFAILVGLMLVNLIQPGWGAEIPLTARVAKEELTRDESLFGIFLRMIPRNIFQAFGDNSAILQVIVFSILFGVFLMKTGGEAAGLLKRFFDAGFQVMMQIAGFVLKFIPFGVVALIARVVGASGLAVFLPLLKLMLTVVGSLAFHSLFTLPLLLWVFGRVRPWAWARAMAPALLTAFSTSSSSVTLPVTMRTVEKRGGVSNRVASFVLPLGATINMDGTALYECVGVIFLAQFYASSAGYDLSLGKQIVVVITALLASIGAAGIPSAGLVMMTTILSALQLPLEGVVLLLAIDRPLDMLRTAVNIWSDTTCAAVVAATEGEAVAPLAQEAAEMQPGSIPGTK